MNTGTETIFRLVENSVKTNTTFDVYRRCFAGTNEFNRKYTYAPELDNRPVNI